MDRFCAAEFARIEIFGVMNAPIVGLGSFGRRGFFARFDGDLCTGGNDALTALAKHRGGAFDGQTRIVDARAVFADATGSTTDRGTSIEDTLAGLRIADLPLRAGFSSARIGDTVAILARFGICALHAAAGFDALAIFARFGSATCGRGARIGHTKAIFAALSVIATCAVAIQFGRSDLCGRIGARWFGISGVVMDLLDGWAAFALRDSRAILPLALEATFDALIAGTRTSPL